MEVDERVARLYQNEIEFIRELVSKRSTQTASI